MNNREELIDAISRNDLEAIKRLRLSGNTIGIVVDVDGIFYTADLTGKPIQLTEEQNRSLSNAIPITCSMDVLPLIFQI